MKLKSKNGTTVKLRTILTAAFAALTVMFAGCASMSRIQNMINRGDKVGALELLCTRLSRNPADEEAVPLFVQIYPSVIDEVSPRKEVMQVRRDFANKYNTSEINAIKKILDSMSKKNGILYQSDISAVISESSSIINSYAQLVRVQKAVNQLPASIGNDKTGVYTVEKIRNNYTNSYDNAKKELGEFYYNIAEAYYPGDTIDDRKTVIAIYKMASSFSISLNAISDKLASLNYLIAVDLLNQNKNGDITKSELQEIMGYLEDAGDYKNAKQLLIEVKYYLAGLYEQENSIRSFEEAGKLYEEISGYKDSYYKAQLYRFYITIGNLKKSYKSGNITLSHGNYTNFNLQKTELHDTNGSTYFRVNNKTSKVDIYSNDYRTVIYPGSIINGESIASQDYTKFKYGSRNQLDFELNSEGRIIAEGKLLNPSDGSYTEKEIYAYVLKNVSNIYPEFSYEFYELNSPDDLKFSTAIGAGRKKVAYANETSRWNPKKSYTLVKVTQKYYTVKANVPSVPIKMFAADKNVVLSSNVKDVCPYYVEKVDYGRKAYFVISSDLTYDEIVSDFKTARPRDNKNSGATGLRVNPEIESKWGRNNTLVSAITICDKYYSINDISGIYNWIKPGTQMAVEINEIVPISFTLRSVYDNSYAVLSQTGDVSFVAQVKPQPAPVQPAQASQPAQNNGNGNGNGNSNSNGNTNLALEPALTDSLVFIGPHGTYPATSISVDRGSGVKTWYFDIPASDIENCTASWNTSEYKSVTINGIQMTMKSTVYSFRDVCGNTISLDTVDAKGNRVHNLLLVRKK